MNMIVDSPVLSAEMGVGGMATERLEAEITSFAADLTAALCRWLLLVGEYDRRGAYEQWECVSMAQWLGVHVGISAVTARQHVIVARRLGVLPAVTEAFGQGRVSYSRVRALCRVATPQDETSWLDLAVHATAAQLDRIVSDTIGAVNARDPDQGARQVAARRLSWSFDDDGLCHLTAVLPPDTGAVLGRLLKAERDDSHDCKDEVDQRNADAFTRLLQRLAAGQEVPGDTPVTSDAPVPGPDGRTGAVPGVVAMIVVHVHEDGTAQLEDGPYVSAGVVDRLAPNAVYLTATHSEDAIRYGHRRRTPPPAMRRYLANRDRRCCFTGCGTTKSLHAHHVKEYVADNGETIPANLILLCARHHGAIHRRGWTVSGNPETGTLEFRNPAGQLYQTNQNCTGDPDRLTQTNREIGIRPGRDTITPKDRGARYDHELAVWIMANHTQRQTPPASDSAETN